VSVIAGVVPLDPASPEERSALPIWSRDRRWRLAWSGRIDNRAEFARRFSIEAPGNDSQLAADAIAAGGIAALGAAIGDFVVVAWDAVERRLWLARDAIGFRPLFYLHQSHQLWFSTDLRWLADGPARERAINEGYVAEYLAGVAVNIDETRIDGVCRVVPAEAMGFTFGARETERVVLWRPPTTLPARRSDSELIEEFRERFVAAVTRSVGAAHRVSTQLSGGLDSTSVSAAARLITGHPPDAYSLVYPSLPTALDGEMLDESPYIDAAVALVGCRSVRFDPLGPGGLGRADFLRVMTRHGDVPDFPVTDALNYALFSRGVSDGHTVMLTGLGGDYWLTGSTSRLPSLIRRGRLVDAWRFHRDARHPDTIGATPAQIRAHLLARLTPGWIKSVYRRAWSPRRWPAWLPQEFTTRVDLAARMRRLSARVPDVDDDVLQDSLLMLSMGGPLLARESVYRAAADAGSDAGVEFDVRHPMLDRDFVEFVMMLPDDLRMRGAESRYILRRALGAWLPPMIRDRGSKGDATTLLGAAISLLLAGRTSIDGRASARGWIDPATLWPRLEMLSRGDFRDRMPAEGDDHLWAAVAIETWLSERGA
jgi:asparagine synthase (glutamine-hydrolysing)